MSSICLNEFNEFYYIEFQQLAKEAKEKNNKNMVQLYKKVAVSIQKYPFPILTSSQAMLLDGVGESIAKIFEKLITTYKGKITSEKINYIEKAYNTNTNNKRTKKGKRKAQTDTEDNKNKNSGINSLNSINKSNIKLRKNLTNIEPYSSVWSSVVCAYILHVQTSNIIFDFNDILAMSRTLSDELAQVKKIDISQGLTDFKEMKSLNLIENFDQKEEKVKINDFLIKLAKIELRKSGIRVENDGNGVLNFEMGEIESDKFNSVSVNTQKNNSSLNFSQNSNYVNPFQTIRKSALKTSIIKENSAHSVSSANSSKNKIEKNTTLDSFIASKKKYKEEEDEGVMKTKYNFISDLATKFLHFRKTKPNSHISSDNIILLVDNREKGPKGEKFPEEILKLRPDIVVQERNLAVGDFMWIYIDPVTEMEFALDFVIERKTTDDLASSIIDGRYNEQKYRLKNCGINNVYYIFEGGSANFYSRGNVSKQAINTAVYNTLNIHDINIVRTPSIEESVNFLIRFDDMVRKNGDIYAAFSTSIDNSLDKKILFSEFTQTNAKTKNSTVENIFIRQLRCFTDCGAKSVDVLRTVFKCPRNIYSIVHKIENEEIKENLITTATYLFENNIELTEENLLSYADPDNFKNLKKEVKSIKKIRKTANTSIINFYS